MMKHDSRSCHAILKSHTIQSILWSDSKLFRTDLKQFSAILWRFSKATTFGGSNIDPTAWEEKKCK
ncbi:hypothetical protein Ccrd_022382, partial [Cynara cardunculus var. scolymus]